MVKKGIEYVGRGAAWVAEKAVAELGLVSAIASTASDGNYFSKVAYGLSTPVRIAFNFGKDYATNEGIRDSVNVGALDVMEGLGNIARNVTENPVETGLAALTAFGACKVAPIISRNIRRNVRESSHASE